MSETQSEDAPASDWFEMNPRYPEFQYEAWRNAESANVLVIEEQRQPDSDIPTFEVHILPENFTREPTPEETLVETQEFSDAIITAHRRMGYPSGGR